MTQVIVFPVYVLMEFVHLIAQVHHQLKLNMLKDVSVQMVLNVILDFAALLPLIREPVNHIVIRHKLQDLILIYVTVNKIQIANQDIAQITNANPVVWQVELPMDNTKTTVSAVPMMNAYQNSVILQPTFAQHNALHYLAVI